MPKQSKKLLLMKLKVDSQRPNFITDPFVLFTLFIFIHAFIVSIIYRGICQMLKMCQEAMVNTFPDFHNQGNDIHMCRLHTAYLCCCCLVTSVVSDSVDCDNSPGRNTRVGCHALLQRIFPTQALNLGLLYCRQIVYH